MVGSRVYNVVADLEMTMVALPVVVTGPCVVLRLENELAV